MTQKPDNPQVTDRRPIHCSFCGKSAQEVSKLIAGPTAFICDECTALCAAIVCASSVQNQGQFFVSFLDNLPTQIANMKNNTYKTEATHD